MSLKCVGPTTWLTSMPVWLWKWSGCNRVLLRWEVRRRRPTDRRMKPSTMSPWAKDFIWGNTRLPRLSTRRWWRVILMGWVPPRATGQTTLIVRWKKYLGRIFKNSLHVWMPRSLGISQRVGLMYCPRKHSGSMPAVQARLRLIRGGIRSPPTTPISRVVDTPKLAMWAYMMPTRGAFLICTEMCWSGRPTGTVYTIWEHRPILRVQLRAPAVSIGAALGMMRAPPCVRPAAPTTTPASVTATLASVSVSKSSQTRPAPNWNCSGVPISRTSATSHGWNPATERAMCGTATWPAPSPYPAPWM